MTKAWRFLSWIFWTEFFFFFPGVERGLPFLGQRIFFLHPGVSELFPIKGQGVGIFGLVVSVTAAQLCHGSRKAAAASGEVPGCGCAPMKRIYDNKRLCLLPSALTHHDPS